MDRQKELVCGLNGSHAMRLRWRRREHSPCIVYSLCTDQSLQAHYPQPAITAVHGTIYMLYHVAAAFGMGDPTSSNSWQPLSGHGGTDVVIELLRCCARGGWSLPLCRLRVLPVDHGCVASGFWRRYAQHSLCKNLMQIVSTRDSSHILATVHKPGDPVGNESHPELDQLSPHASRPECMPLS